MTTLILQCAASDHDAVESNTGGMQLTRIGQTFGHATSQENHGYHFPSVSGIGGRVIDSAFLNFQPASSDTQTSFEGNWFAEDAAAPPVFTTTASNITDRTQTSATCEGDGVDFGSWTSGVRIDFLGDGVNFITNIIAELAASYDPSTIVMIYVGTVSGSNRTTRTFDFASDAAAKLTIDYTEPFTTGAVAMSGVGTMAIGAALTTPAKAAMSGVGSMAVAANIGTLQTGAAAMSGVGTMVPKGVITASGKVAMSGVGSMSVIGETGQVLFTQFGNVFRLIDPADYPTGAEFFLEASLAAINGTARARLFNLTTAAAVASSELTTTDADATRLRSPALTLASGANTYRVEYGGEVGGDYTAHSADLVVETD